MHTRAALELPTPVYLYALDDMERAADEIVRACAGRGHVFYALKANSAGPVVRALAGRGCGADVVSGGELLLARACGISPEHVVFSGVAKTDVEIDLAVAEGIGAVQVESLEEIARVTARARAIGRRARVAIRINPGLDRDELVVHDHVATGHDAAKFGVAVDDLGAALRAVDAGSDALTLVGLSAHAGSQLPEPALYVASARRVFEAARAARVERVGRALAFVDTGGGFAVDYTGTGSVAPPAVFVKETLAAMDEAGVGDLALHVEPGRALVAPFGVLVGSVIQRKVSSSGRRWLLLDAGMNDLLRPALYQARHRIVALGELAEPPGAVRPWRVVGPICESADDFGEHMLPDHGFDRVAILDAGAYGFTMASRYNGRALPGEAFLRDGRVEQLFAREPMAAWVTDRIQRRL